MHTPKFKEKEGIVVNKSNTILQNLHTSNKLLKSNHNLPGICVCKKLVWAGSNCTSMDAGITSIAGLNPGHLESTQARLQW